MYSSARRSVVPLWRRIHVTSLASTSDVTNWRSSSDRWAVVTIGAAARPSGAYSSDWMSSGWPAPHAANAGEASSPLSFMRQLRAVGGREELVELEHAELADRRLLDHPDERRQVERRAGRPRVLDEVGQQDVLAAGQRVGVDADEAEQAGHVALDLVADDLGVVGRRHLQRADDVERHARLRARACRS